MEKRLGLWKKGVKSKLLTTIEKMVKGGARNFAKPSVDPGLVLKILKDNAEVVKDLGAYETVSRASAVQPHGLLQVRHLLEDIIEVSPTCELQASVLRTALMNLLTSNISLNNTQFNGNTWSNQKAERITVLLCHTRKVARDKEVQRICAAKLTAREYQLLEAVTSKIIQKEEEALEKGLKVLQARVSDASLDSDGFPNILKSPKDTKDTKCTGLSHPLKKGKGASSTAMVPVLDHWELQAAMGYGSKAHKKPAAKPSTKMSPKKGQPLTKKAKKKGQPLIKKTAGPDPSKSWVSLRVTSAKDPERTYLTGCQEGSTQRRLVVEVPAKWSKDHKGIILRIKKDMEEKKLTKGDAIALRSKLVR